MDERDDVEALKQLKARYFRAVDGKDWDALRGIVTDDFVLDMRPAPTDGAGDDRLGQIREGRTVEGGDAFVAFTRAGLDRATTVHHGHMPEITVTSSTTATGIWALEDLLRWSSGLEVHGYGHYTETYVKGGDGTWRIATSTLTRLRLDVSER